MNYRQPLYLRRNTLEILNKSDNEGHQQVEDVLQMRLFTCLIVRRFLNSSRETSIIWRDTHTIREEKSIDRTLPGKQKRYEIRNRLDQRNYEIH